MIRKKVITAVALVSVLLASVPMTGMAYAEEIKTAAQTNTENQESKAEVNQFMDCIDPIPIMGTLSGTCWGAAEVGARDQDNGLEDKTLENYCYWDGGIVKDEETGTYYMFASRWNQAGGHWGQNTDSGWVDGWQGSQAIYATSDNLYGPYTDQGPIWPDWCEGAGHNVFPFALSEKDELYKQGYRYAISISDTGKHGDVANGTIHIAKSIKGPWELIDNGNGGKLKATGGNGFSLSNISITVRPDGTYEATNRNGDIAIADSVAGTWQVKENDLWNKIEGISTGNIEDPVIWYSDGQYHIVANKWDVRMAYYLTSEDGITNWKKHPGTAYTPQADFLKYEDGTVNRWTKLERPNIYVEDGKIKAMTFAVIDVQKEQDYGSDQHGSKVIVVPFSSDKLQQLDAQPNPLENREGIAASADTTLQTWWDEAGKNYGGETFLQMQKSPDATNQLGEGNKRYNEYDNKIALVKFDLTNDEFSENSEITDAELSVVYLGRKGGSLEEVQVQAVLADTKWQEGSGVESVNGNQTNTGDATWNNQPSLYYDVNDADTVALSESFNVADLKRVVKLDVTKILNKYKEEHPDATSVSFALNVTGTESRFHFGSREESDKRLVPRLKVTTKEKESESETKPSESETKPSESETKPGESETKPGGTPDTKADQAAAVKLNYTALTMQKGKKTTALKASAVIAGDRIISWSSSRKSVATVSSNGKIKAKRVGTTQIKVKTAKGATATCKVRVTKKAVKTTKLTVKTKKVTLKKGKSYQICITRKPVTASDKVSYRSSDSKCVSVSAKGKIKAKKKGSAKITVKTESGKKQIIRINVK